MKTCIKKWISVLLVVCSCISLTIGSMNGLAAEKQDIYTIILPRANDKNQNGWGHPSLNFLNGWSMEQSDNMTAIAVDGYEGKSCYCIEPGKPLHTGDTLSKELEDFWDNYPSSYNKTIEPDDIKLFIGRIMQYGWTGNCSLNWTSDNGQQSEQAAHYIATQLLVWETVVGERDEDFNHVDAKSSGKSSIKDSISSSHPLKTSIFSYYSKIESAVKQHTVTPSGFSKIKTKANTLELKWDGNQYVTTITDKNNVLDNYRFSGAGLNFKISGDQLTISSSSSPADGTLITAEKKNSKRKALITWTDYKIDPKTNQIQDIVTYGENVNDPVTAYLKVKVSNGSAKIVKTSEDNKVDGISFRISGNGINKTVKTDSNGKVEINNLSPGIYTVTEQAYDKYEPQETRRVTVIGGQTATVTFNNVLKRGSLAVTKTSEDGLTKGVTFRLSGISLSGLPVNEFAVTDASGKAVFKDVLISGGTPYILEEVDTDIKYVVPDKQTAVIEWNKVTNQSFHNILKKWNATVTKSDSATGTAQGDASLAGAVYGVYKGDQLIDTYTTDQNGQFTTDFYICGSDWSMKEISPSEGYLLNSISYHVGAEPQRYTIEYNSTALDVLETIRKGKIAIIKHCDNGSTQIETPESGAEFEVYLKSAGSYAKAKDTERDILVCDQSGFAQTKTLPYGVYVVKQTKGWDGKELMPAFDVFVKENGEVYRYLINNTTFEALIEIVKKDAETGKVIPAAGVGFKVRNTDTGEYIVQHLNYPTPTDIDIYYTDSTGKLMLPEPLEYGNFEIIEQCTAYGYVLSSKPVPFTVDGTQTVVTVEKHNTAQKGKITISKSGEVFSSVTESNGIYQPVYSVSGLGGAIYKIYADEDIVTLDGTVRARKGDLVGTVKTKSSGAGTSEPLYLGRYKILESKAPYGMIINKEPVYVELTYAGQEVEVTAAYADYYNERQKLQIKLDKILEQDETFNIGMNGEILSVQFGLYAAKDLIAADGAVIPQYGLIEIASCDENGKAVFKTDLPVGSEVYIKEYSADVHYLISNKTYPVQFEYAGQNIKTVSIDANDGKYIGNDLKRGSVVGKKTDEDGFAVGGALFGLFKADETGFKEETALLTAESDETGLFIFESVPFGNWLIRELKPAPSFVLNETVYPVTISESEEIIEIEVENRFIVGSVQTEKVDAEYPDRKLSGAEFEVYMDVDGDKKFNAEIDKLVREMDEIEDGVFRLGGLRYNGYFLYEKLNPEGFLKDDNYYYFEISKDGETVIVENKAGIGFVNRPITGELEITKKDISDGRLLPGVGFRIKNEKDEIVAEGYTDENGIAKFTLRYGKYTYQEFDPLDGYQVDDTEYPFEIKQDGEIIKAEMTNEKIPVTDIPQTGDNSNIGFWIGLGGVALGGLIACGIVCIKRKKDDDDE